MMLFYLYRMHQDKNVHNCFPIEQMHFQLNDKHCMSPITTWKHVNWAVSERLK